MSSASILIVKKSVTSKAHLLHMSEILILLSLSCKVFNLWYSNIFSNFVKGGMIRSQVGQRVWTLNLSLLQKLLFPDDEFWNNQLSSLTSRSSHDNTDTRLVKLTSLCLNTQRIKEIKNRLKRSKETKIQVKNTACIYLFSVFTLYLDH